MQSGIASVHRCFALVHSAVNSLLGLNRGRKNDLSLIAISILHASCAGKVRMNDLSDTFDVKLSTVSGCVDNLESRGLVTRTRSTEDKRVVYVEPTGTGKDWVREHDEKIESYIGKCMSRLTGEEQKEFVRLFNKFMGLETQSYHALLAELNSDTNQ
jgi:DNA-binding MarR family transcriptional regulator